MGAKTVIKGRETSWGFGQKTLLKMAAGVDDDTGTTVEGRRVFQRSN